jgi:hypothetical protein
MQQKDAQLTKIPTDLRIATSLDLSPSQVPNHKCTSVVFTSILPGTGLSKSYSSQTSKFPVQSSHGYNYVMILYDHNSNLILSKPLKTCHASKLTKVWTSLHTPLQFNGFALKLHILNNECSDELRGLSKSMTLLSNASCRIVTAAMQPNKPSILGRTIYAQALPHAAPSFCSPSGTYSCHRPTLHSISCTPPFASQDSWPMPAFMARLTLTTVS